MTPPSGRQITIAAGEQEATIVEVGGGIRTYDVAGEPVIDGYGVDEMCGGGRGQVLLPWPNRIGDGAFAFEGTHHQLPLTEPARRNAIHGLTRFASWTVEAAADDRAVLGYALHPQPGYPFALQLRVEYRIGGAGLSVRCEATNEGPRCPFGAGFHPYIRGPVDEMVLTSPAATWYETDERGLPRRTHPVDGSPYDFRAPAAIGARRLDTAFTDLARDGEGRAAVVVESGGREITVWLGPRYTDLMLYTGDTLEARRRGGLAIEPMTCPPDAFRTGERVIVLEAGETFEEWWGISSRSR